MSHGKTITEKVKKAQRLLDEASPEVREYARERHGLAGAVGYFGAGKGGKLYINRRTANAFALRRRLDPHRKDHVSFYAGGLAEWPALRRELAELRSPTMEVEDGQVKQVLEDKDALAARLHHSPDLLDALLMTFTFSE